MGIRRFSVDRGKSLIRQAVQHKRQALSQYQQTRGTLAMVAHWISWAFAMQHQDQTAQFLLTEVSARLHVPAFRGAVLR